MASQSSVLAQFLLSLQGEILRHAGASGCQSCLPLRADPEHPAGPESQVLVFCIVLPLCAERWAGAGTEAVAAP